MIDSTHGSPNADFWRDRLAAWLREWEISNNLKQADSSDGVVDGLPDEVIDAKSLVNVCEEPIQVGDIRILSSRLIGETDLPVYVAVISEWEDGDWLFAPYCEFSEPATTGELLTGRSDFGLRVLCLWNAHTISSNDLSFSFLEDSMNEEERKEAWAVFRSVSVGDDLPANLENRVGPPITHPKDPRISYQEECKALMAPVRDLWDLPWIEFPLLEGLDKEVKGSPIDFTEAREPQFEYALAAAEMPKANHQVFRLKGLPYFLIVQFVPESNEIFFSLEDDSGAVSELDGYQVSIKSGDNSKHCLEGGQLSLPIDGKTLEFLLIDREGVVVDLIEKK